MTFSETRQTDGLIEQLKARLDRIEEVAKACIATDWRMPDRNHIVDRDVDGWRSISDDSRVFSAYGDREAELLHAVNHDPDAVLGLVAAIREILELHSPITTYECTTCYESWSTYPCPTIKALAKGYGIKVEQ